MRQASKACMQVHELTNLKGLTLQHGMMTGASVLPSQRVIVTFDPRWDLHMCIIMGAAAFCMALDQRVSCKNCCKE